MASHRGNQGFSIIEILLAAALFVIIAGGVVEVILQGLENNRGAQEQTQASQFLSEGFEAVRSIKQQGYANLVNSTGTGVAISAGIWTFAGANNTFSKFTRTITVGDVNRDGSGNIVASGGTVDPQTKKITVTVTWNAIDAVHQNTISQTQYLTNWKKRGVLVYGDGGTTTDAMKFQIFDPDKDTWSTAASVADVDVGTTNRAARVLQLYSSTTRNEKILISRHFDGTVQYIYAQVYNGVTWDSVQLLSSWTANTHVNVRNFDGTYTANGDFMVVYSDNTSTPKMRTWNGSSWSSQSSLTSLGGATELPTWVRISARPGTNEVMAAFLTEALDTISEYWSGSTWSAITTHATATFNNNRQGMDFAWSTHTTTIGAITYQTAGGDKTPRVRLFAADGSGGGTWQAQVNGADIAAGQSIVALSPRSTADEFSWCDKDQQATPDTTCRKITFSGSTATFTTPTNPIIFNSTVNGLMVTYQQQYETVSGDPAIIAYTDNTNVPKFKKYNAGTSTWDASATNITTTGTPGIFQTFRTIPNPHSDDMMILMADANLDVFSIVWDGFNNVMYSSPAARAYTAHGASGSAVNEYWYDFSWDN